MIWNRCVGACALVGALVVFQDFAAGAIETGSEVKLYDSVGSGPGGQFTVKHVGGLGSFTNFETFCLEKSETIQLDKRYFVTLEPNALNGAAGSLGSVPALYDPNSFNASAHGDPVGGGVHGHATQWLFQYFALNKLDTAGLGYSSGNTASANALQNVFWYLQNEIGSLAAGLEMDLYDWAVDMDVYTGYDADNPNLLYKVWAMNLWTHNPSPGIYSGPAQSQLVLLSEPRPQFGSPVPEPMSVAVWGVLVGVGSVVAWRRRRLGEG
jgi:hypothetical protein